MVWIKNSRLFLVFKMLVKVYSKIVLSVYLQNQKREALEVIEVLIE